MDLKNILNECKDEDAYDKAQCSSITPRSELESRSSSDSSITSANSYLSSPTCSSTPPSNHPSPRIPAIRPLLREVNDREKSESIGPVNYDPFATDYSYKPPPPQSSVYPPPPPPPPPPIITTNKATNYFSNNHGTSYFYYQNNALNTPANQTFTYKPPPHPTAPGQSSSSITSGGGSGVWKNAVTSTAQQLYEDPQLKPFQCSTCAKRFARKSDLVRHERIHTGDRPNKCHVCDKAFIQRSALTVHSRVHTGEKPHKCDTCDKSFSDSSSLARHRRVHTGSRPYACSYPGCGKTFTRRTTLTRHSATHNGWTQVMQVPAAHPAQQQNYITCGPSVSQNAPTNNANQHHEGLWTPAHNTTNRDSFPRTMPGDLHPAQSAPKPFFQNPGSSSSGLSEIPKPVDSLRATKG
ncbi:hypothetical protein TRICI_001381 [Trichomonascus ciferrii]|uniref:C2H2-type domain-containing protein n=1 Tax=Trichomonascus ciferrii TaxID=44093 RepID=A0A642V9L0_9ASCO|nr:hypothetical protein TRICI_001381 [Trichomonascus ciferrii]